MNEPTDSREIAADDRGQLVAVRFVWQHVSSDGSWIDTLGMPWYWSFAEARQNPSGVKPSRLVARHMYDLVVSE